MMFLKTLCLLLFVCFGSTQSVADVEYKLVRAGVRVRPIDSDNRMLVRVVRQDHRDNEQNQSAVIDDIIVELKSTTTTTTTTHSVMGYNVQRHSTDNRRNGTTVHRPRLHSNSSRHQAYAHQYQDNTVPPGSVHHDAELDEASNVQHVNSARDHTRHPSTTSNNDNNVDELSSLAMSTTTTVTDNDVEILEDKSHVYYTSRVVSGPKSRSLWVDDSIMLTQGYHHSSLSSSHQTAITYRLSFNFLYYGHEVNQVTIATGGFLYMSDFIHKYLTATQYIAPLMADYDTRLGRTSHIVFIDNGSMLTVWWRDVYIKEFIEAGPFSFQASLYKDGRIIFSYQKVPFNVSSLPQEDHPVRVGLADAYYMDQQHNTVSWRRTVYEYHRVEVDLNTIDANMSIIFAPLPTCRQLTTCEKCVEARLPFDCQWCQAANRCSDGLDRQRQQWLKISCHTERVRLSANCSAAEYYYSMLQNATRGESSGGEVSAGVVVGIAIAVVCTCLLIYVAAWLLYAYLHPNSRSGIWLIKHWPAKLFTNLRMHHSLPPQSPSVQSSAIYIQQDESVNFAAVY